MRVLLIAALLLAPATLNAQEQIGVGFLAAEIPMGPYQRYGFVQGLAKHLGRAVGRPARGFAYRTEGDLRRDIKARKVHLAVVGGFHLASNRTARVLANGRLAARHAGRWSLMGKHKLSMTALRDKILQLPGVGRIVVGLVENGLLGGYLKVRKHFKIRRSPGLASAREAVRLDKAQATFAPINSKGLVQLVQRSIPAPPPALVLLDATMPPEQVKKVVGALRSYRDPSGSIRGWTAARPAVYLQLARLSRKSPMRMVLLPPRESLRTRLGGLVDIDPGQALDLLPLDNLYELP